ncbi:MAG: dipeptidase [Armatimonadota bacterium]
MSNFHHRSIIAVMHDHCPIAEDVPRMLAGGVTCKCFQVSLDVDVEAGTAASATIQEGWLRRMAEGMEAALVEIDATGSILVRAAADIERAKAEGKAAIMLGCEGSRWLEGSLAPLRLFHWLGLREMQLAWIYPNHVVPDGQLSDFGRQVIAECNRLGVIVDLTHLPPNVFLAAAEASAKPVIVSHGSCAAVTTDLSDRQLQALADTGGLLCVHFFNTYLGDDPTPEDVVKQVDHVAQTVGIDHVALGCDFFPTEGAWRKLQEDQNTLVVNWAIDDLSQMPRITQALLDRGYSEADVQKVLGLNFLRVCQEVFGS